MKENISIIDLLLLDTELAVKWSDEKESFIPLKLLRDNCPCAFCSGEKDVLGNVYKGPEKKLEAISYKAINMKNIGRYALQIFWGDKHADGLFTYALLRKLGDS